MKNERSSSKALEILKSNKIYDTDKIWIVMECLDDKTQRLFAVWCARRALTNVRNPDPRSIQACDVAERFANGEATQDELSIACDTASDAACAAAARAASAVTVAAYAAASAATAAAYVADVADTDYAAYVADHAVDASFADTYAERKVQVNYLISILESE